ncbi:hypothetical protein K449DRAFT_182248 [Hypoxylon sp. EC38]|nr:hypothetical protein K449DRAFT_182248 [Hypoxylon sp. EC38]
MSTIDQPYGRYILTLIHIVLLATKLTIPCYGLYPNRRELPLGSVAKSALNAKGNLLCGGDLHPSATPLPSPQRLL